MRLPDTAIQYGFGTASVRLRYGFGTAGLLPTPECENGAVPNEHDSDSGEHHAHHEHHEHAKTPQAIAARKIDWMVFDLGNVVLYQNDTLPELALRIGADPTMPEDLFRAAYNAPRRDYDLYSDAARYWGAVAVACGAPQPDARAVAALTDMDVTIWSRTNSVIIGMFSELRDAGIRLAVLSNAPTAMGDHVRRQSWSLQFEKIVISGEIGLVKPNAAIYGYLLGELEAPASRVAFADDLTENIDSANAAGIRGMLFSGPTALRAGLIDLGVSLGS